MSAALAGSRRLFRATLEQDGRHFAPWVVLATALSTSSVLVYPWVFPTAADRTALATAIGANPALGLIFGPAHDLTITDGFNAWRSLALGGFLAALGAIFAVTRASRAQEDSGQAELLASSVLGRSSRLLVAFGVACIGSVVLGVVAGLLTVACGGGWQPSLLLGAGFTVTGILFGAVAAVTAQLGADAHAANSLAVSTLAVLYLARGFSGAMQAPEWTLWINPLGWTLQTLPATENRWWPLALPLLLAALLLVVAFVLQSRRDFGIGAIPARPGPVRGSVRSVLGLVVRLGRTSLITWGIAAIALGFVFGYLATSVKDLLGNESGVQQILAAGATTPDELVGAFLVTILSLLGIITAIPGVQIMVRVRTEELEERVEPILASPIHRGRYYGANVLLALVSPAIYLLLAATVIAFVASGDKTGLTFGQILLQGVAAVPAVWALVAVAVAVVGARPHVIIASWVGVLAGFGLTILGPTFKLWDWVLAISPFWHVPKITTASPDWWGLLGVGAVTALLVLIGFVGFRRRDVAV